MTKLVIVVVFAFLSLPSCGGNEGNQEATGEEPAAPAGDVSPYEAPQPDTVPLAKAKKGDLIALPFYPGVGKYGGTADVRGMKTFEMRMPLIESSRMFGPSVLIGSPGQKIKLTGFDAPKATRTSLSFHNFKVSDTADFSSDHQLLDDWKESKGSEFTVTFPEEGKLAFYCSYHLKIYMAGMLIVRD